MKALITAVTVLTLSTTVAFAGPNQGAHLTVHGNVTGVETNGDICTSIPIPPTCEDTVPESEPVNGVEWFIVLAAGFYPLAFNTVTFGVGDYDSGTCYIGFYGPCRAELNPLEIPSDGWPGPNAGTAVSWAPNCLDGLLVPIYYFGVYAYGPGVVPLGDFYPGQVATVVSCDNPPEEDLIEAFGTFGCGGAHGQQVCFEDAVGACCLPNGDCIILTQTDCEDNGGLFIDGGACDPNPCVPFEGACCVDTNGDGNAETCTIATADDCAAQGGDYLGDGSDCDPPPCPPDPIATQQSTWGQIKRINR